MQKWVVLGILVLLVFGNLGFVFAEQFQEVKGLQVKTEKCDSCPYQGFDVDKALSEVDAKIENLTKVINQKEVELQKLYAELNRTKSVEILEKIVKLEDEVQLLKSQREFYKRRKNDLKLIKKYTVKTLYGLKVLYYKLPPKKHVIAIHVQEIKKINPKFNASSVEELITFYRQASELTFYKTALIDLKISSEFESDMYNMTLVVQLLQKRKYLWNKIYEYLTKRDELYTLSRLWDTQNYQIEPKILDVPDFCYYNGRIWICSEIREGYLQDEECCLTYYGIKQPLPENVEITFTNVEPTVVWIGMYSSQNPDISFHFADWCTYTFPSDNDENTIKTLYWDTAYELARSLGEPLRSIQIKFFYKAYAQNPDSGDIQEANLIYQYECYYTSAGTVGCWPSPGYGGTKLPLNPLNPGIIKTEVTVFPYYLACKCYGDCGGYGCSYAKWANGHCNGCFAPDESTSQNFATIG
ncbi:hypothetical protein VFC49_05980 [Thermococcus sp. SY098]|uniref:hypothetical protein n=1 Tax=Thermococcus sp. SY098 TaxID=3111325 RepID=UPI002D796ADE|nr:hypothetical protein [Thermococcus sp. SY098]WRS51654.1 hypothetical protein VFC49_05980 [Thermococcus sp. SY098]